MPQADTSRAQLSYKPEAAFGTIDAAGNPFNLRMTGESLDFTIGMEKSKEIRSDRQNTDLVQVSAQAAGGYNFELSYAEYDDFFEALLQGTWAVYGTNGVGTTFSATYTATTITAGVAPVGTSAFTGLALGQWFKVTAPTGLNAGKWFKVSESVSPTTTVITLDAGTPAEVEGPIATTAVQASRLVNGTTQRSFSLQKAFTDINQFFAYRGMTASRCSMGFQSGQIVSGAFDFLGKDSLRAGATQLPGAPVASQTYDVMNAVAGVGQIFEGSGLLTGTFIKSLSFDYDNMLRGRDAIGTLGNVSVGAGTIDCKGSLEIYLADGTLYDKFVANTASQISARVQDAAGNGYVLTFGRLKYADAKVNAGAKDQDAMISLPFEAFRHPTKGFTLAIDRAGVAVP